jgi:hypothetical protein
MWVYRLENKHRGHNHNNDDDQILPNIYKIGGYFIPYIFHAQGNLPLSVKVHARHGLHFGQNIT